MKKNEFLLLVHRQKKARAWVLVLALSWIFVCVVILFLVLIKFNAHVTYYTLPILGILSFMGLAACILFYERLAYKKAGLVCSSCATIFDKNDIGIIVSTGNCPHCGANVIDNLQAKQGSPDARNQ